MGSENQVSVEITLEERAALKALDNFNKRVSKAEDALVAFGTTADKNMSLVGQATQGLSDGFGSLVKGVTVANLVSDAITGTASAMIDFKNESIKASIEQQAAINKISQALRVSGEYTEEAVADFDAYADSLERASKHEGDTILNQLAIAKSFRATNDQAKDLVLAAANLAATFGGDLESRVKQLGQTLNGEVGKLGKLPGVFKDLTAEQLKSGEAIRLVNQMWGNAAANEMKDYEGQLELNNKAIGKAQEELGNLYTQNPLVLAALSSQTGAWATLADYIKNEFAPTFNSVSANILRFFSTDFAKSEQSINLLTENYSNMNSKLEETEKRLADLRSQDDIGFFDRIAISKAAGEVAALKNSLQMLEGQINETSTRTKFADPVAEQAVAQPGTTSISKEDQKRLDSYRQTEIAIRELKAQSLIADQENQTLLDAQAAGRNELEIQQIYEFEALKLEAQLTAEEEKAMLIKDSREKSLKLQELGAKREVEFTKLSNRQVIDEMKKRQAEEEKVQQANLTSAQGFLSAGVALAKEGSAEQKALAYADAMVNTYAAGLRAYKDYPFPANIGVMASTIAAGMVNVRNISRYEQGGIVPGNSFTGDMVQARVNSGEMILNRQQQSSLFAMANGGGSGSSELVGAINNLVERVLGQPIIVQMDGRSVAVAVRSQVQSGFRLT